MIGATKSEQATPPLPKFKPPKPSDQPIFALPDNSSSLKPVTDPTDAATLSPSLALPPHAQDAPVEVNNVVVSSQEPHDAPTEEPSAEEPPEDHLPPQEPRDAPAEEPTAEEPPGSISIQPHGPEISHPESKEDDGHLQPPSISSNQVPQEPLEAPAEEPNVEEPPAKPQLTKADPVQSVTPVPKHESHFGPPTDTPNPVKITVKVFTEHGSSPGCHACLLGGPLAKFNSHDPECRRRFAYLCAGRTWPPPRDHASASAALIALLREPESEPEPRLALISSYVDPYESPGLSLIKANAKTRELREYIDDVSHALGEFNDSIDKALVEKAKLQFPSRLKNCTRSSSCLHGHLCEALEGRTDKGNL